MSNRTFSGQLLDDVALDTVSKGVIRGSRTEHVPRQSNSSGVGLKPIKT